MPIGWVIVLIVIGSLALIAVLVFLYFFVFLRFHYKKQVTSLRKKYSYLDAKLIGQDTQYFHRLEIISRTNLLYLDKYEIFSRRFKGIFENEDKFCESILKQLDSLLAAKKYKGIKKVIIDAKKSIDVFEESVNSFDHDLYEIIKLEEDCRKKIDASKETYRHIKQTYYTESNDIEMVVPTFTKTFEKIDDTFARYDELIESAEYDEINSGLPELNDVLTALGRILIELPTLCSLTKTVLAEKIQEVQQKYRETEKNGLPLFHLNFKAHVDDWKKRTAELSKKLVNLQTYGIRSECDLIITEINDMHRLLDEEVSSREYFNAHYRETYSNVNEVEKTFVKLCASLPQVKEYYLIGDEQKKINELATSVGNLTNAKRFLEGFVYSGIRQPYSLLRKQLDELIDNYETVSSGVKEFKAYIESLKNTAEEAYKMIFTYYHRVKEIEKCLDEIGVKDVSNSYQEKIDAVYEILNDIYIQLQSKPINVEEISTKNEQLKNIANAMFEEIDEKVRESALAESTLVKLNMNLDETDVEQMMSTYVNAFYKGDFKNVYNQAEILYRSKFIEQ